MFKLETKKETKGIIKSIIVILIILFISVSYFIVSQVKTSMEERIKLQEEYISYIKVDVSNSIESIYVLLDRVRSLPSFDDVIFNLQTLFDKSKEDALFSKHIDIIFESEPIDYIFIINEQSREILKIFDKNNLEDDLEDSINAIVPTLTNNDIELFNISNKSNDNKLGLGFAVNENYYDGFNILAFLDYDNLISKEFKNRTEKIYFINSKGEVLFSQDKNGKKTIEKLLDKYGLAFFNEKNIINKNNVNLNVGYLHYSDNNIFVSEELSKDLYIIVSYEFEKYKMLFSNKNAIIILITFIIACLSIVGVLIDSKNRSEKWVKSEKNRLIDIIKNEKTDKFQLESNLRFYKHFFYDSKVPIIILETNLNNIYMANNAALEFYNYQTEEELKKLSLGDICNYDINKSTKQEIETITHYKFERPKEKRLVRIQFTHYDELELLILFVLSHNRISDEKYREMQVEIFHEIRSPLQGAYDANEMIENATSDYNEYTNLIKYSLINVLEMTNSALAIDKISHSRNIVNESNFDVVSLVKDIISSIRFQDSNSNIFNYQVIKKTENDIIYLDNYNIKSDIFKIRHILMNLVSNASEYTKYGKIIIGVEILTSLNQDIIKFSVSDTGKGFDRNEIEVMYDDYEMFDNESYDFKSTELELGIAKKYVEILKSELKLITEINHGSIFSFKLYLEKTLSKGVFLISNKSILVVDNDEINCKYVKQFCEKTFECKVKTLTNENKIFDELSKSKYDCVLLDQNLNFFLGTDIVQLIRSSSNKITSKIPIILMNDSNKDIIKEKYNISKILLKPFTNNELKEEIVKIFKLNINSEIKEMINKSVSKNVIDASMINETINVLGRETFIDMIETFINNSYEDVLELNELIIIEEYELLLAVLHRLKGSLLYFSPIESKNKINSLEAILKEKKYKKFIEEFEEFKINYDALVKELDIIRKKLE